jgi:hypothetical protein
MADFDTFISCLIGLAIFSVGVLLRMYMRIRAKGLAGFVSGNAAVIDCYRKLSREGRAPSWPLPASYVCMIAGICVIFGSILIHK